MVSGVVYTIELGKVNDGFTSDVSSLISFRFVVQVLYISNEYQVPIITHLVG
jgi:hypothetical protein